MTALRQARASGRRAWRAAAVVVLLAGAGLRAAHVWRPVDGSLLHAWRECDVASIARNYAREGMNLFYPRIDWRGDGPGYAEMELPVYPWLIALSYRTLGEHEVAGRLLSLAFSLATLAVFLALARELLPPAGAVGALAFFAVSPLPVTLSSALQPEALMLLLYVLAVHLFLRWAELGGSARQLLAAAASAGALLAKATTAHVGLLFLVVLLRRRGRRALAAPASWAFAALALVPALVWYGHAHRFWLSYGNSLGVSNEYHWASWDLFTNRRFVEGIVRAELVDVLTLASLPVVALGLFWRRVRGAAFVGLAWLASCLAYYLIAARTTADTWARYYHVVSVPPVAILFGAGCATCWALLRREPGAVAELPSWSRRRVAVWIASACVVLSLGLQVRRARTAWDTRRHQELFACAKAFAPHVPAGALILASGGPCSDEDGYPLAFNASYMFYWMDRKGFNVCEKRQSLEAVESFVRRGARFFVAERSALLRQPGFEAELRQRFRVLQECPAAVLFELAPRGGP